ncbi:hypothetical protein BCV70DRAFT_91493 [Testicularia cyperi]|uniref:Secreted protein n=1 Tax=Testicularia cyperi TaxID=1882483 RepID=A0A317XTW2_9BASI|nr:hypothetical protein BCV70DRAFT_91493 [Testicularia cyperi]
MRAYASLGVCVAWPALLCHAAPSHSWNRDATASTGLATRWSSESWCGRNLHAVSDGVRQDGRPGQERSSFSTRTRLAASTLQPFVQSREIKGKKKGGNPSSHRERAGRACCSFSIEVTPQSAETADCRTVSRIDTCLPVVVELEAAVHTSTTDTDFALPLPRSTI